MSDRVEPRLVPEDSNAIGIHRGHSQDDRLIGNPSPKAQSAQVPGNTIDRLTPRSSKASKPRISVKSTGIEICDFAPRTHSVYLRALTHPFNGAEIAFTGCKPGMWGTLALVIAMALAPIGLLFLLIPTAIDRIPSTVRQAFRLLRRLDWMIIKLVHGHAYYAVTDLFAEAARRATNQTDYGRYRSEIVERLDFIALVLKWLEGEGEYTPEVHSQWVHDFFAEHANFKPEELIVSESLFKVRDWDNTDDPRYELQNLIEENLFPKSEF